MNISKFIGLVAFMLYGTSMAATPPKPAAPPKQNVKFVISAQGSTPVMMSARALGLYLVITGSDNSYTVSTQLKFSSLTPDICTEYQYMDGFNRPVFSASLKAPGQCRVAFDINNSKYLGHAEYSFMIDKGKQIIDDVRFQSAITLSINGYGEFWVPNPGTLPTITSTTPEICTATVKLKQSYPMGDKYESAITPLAAGDCLLVLNRPGNEAFNDAPSANVKVTIAGGKISQVITPCETKPITVGGKGEVCFDESKAPVGVRVFSDSMNICTVPSNISKTAVGVKAGTCKIQLVAFGSDVYNEARVDMLIPIIEAGKPEQTIKFGEAPSLTVGSSAKVSATGGDSGNPVTFSSQTTKVCTISEDTVTALDTGTCTIAADQAGNSSFNAAGQVIQSFTVSGAGKTDQKIIFGEAPTVTVGGTGTLSAKGGGSGNAVVFSSQSGDVCTVSGNTVTGVAAGACIVAADQAGSDSFNSATEVTQAISVTLPGKTSQAITFLSKPTLMVNGTATVAAAGGKSDNLVILASLTSEVCTLADGILKGLAEGTCTIAADQEGNDQYDAAPRVTLDIVVTKETRPYSVTVSAEGDITQQTLTASIVPATDDIGKAGNEFVGAKLGELLFLLNESGWVQYEDGGDPTAFSSGLLAERVVTLVANVDLTSIAGASVFVGYGRGATLAESYADMLRAKTLMVVYEVK